MFKYSWCLAIFVVLVLTFSIAVAPGHSQEKARVLILGDSISMGYTPVVSKMLENECVVMRPKRDNRNENCQGTTYGVKNIDRWLQMDGGNWDIIHFNFGLHDLKRVDPETKKNSNNVDHPNQADLETYEKNMRTIVAKLKKTNAKLIFATTTPVPSNVKPHRDADAPSKYNRVAIKIMKENEIEVNDLFEFAQARLSEIQRPNNVHFTKEGSRQLGEKVANVLRKALK